MIILPDGRKHRAEENAEKHFVCVCVHWILYTWKEQLQQEQEERDSTSVNSPLRSGPYFLSSIASFSLPLEERKKRIFPLFFAPDS